MDGTTIKEELLSPEDLADYAKAWGLNPGWPKHPPTHDDQRTALARIIHSHERLRAHADRLAAVDIAARELFRALDYVTPDWREETCVISRDGDEVNVAWCALEAALDDHSEARA